MKQDFVEEKIYEQGPGLCIIINQKNFFVDSSDPNATSMDDRLGTDRSKDKLEETFTLIGAECLIYNHLNHKELVEQMEEAGIQANNQKYFWVAVCVLSHGRRVNGIDEIFTALQFFHPPPLCGATWI